jgi:hypothetical protein
VAVSETIAVTVVIVATETIVEIVDHGNKVKGRTNSATKTKIKTVKVATGKKVGATAAAVADVDAMVATKAHRVMTVLN